LENGDLLIKKQQNYGECQFLFLNTSLLRERNKEKNIKKTSRIKRSETRDQIFCSDFSLWCFFSSHNEYIQTFEKNRFKNNNLFLIILLEKKTSHISLKNKFLQQTDI